VTGKIVFKDSNLPASGARVALFKKKTAVVSPNETIAPDRETYADGKGNFSVEIDDGTYTMLASSDSQCAFVGNLTPASDSAQGMTVALLKSGTIEGEITDALELRESGSVVVRILGTDIFQIVDNSGKFSLDNVPAGDLTLVSYSTSSSEFFPYYQNVSVAPDSVREVNAYALNYSGIPIPKRVMVSYDTVKQTVRISWLGVVGYGDFQEYGILRGIGDNTRHDLKQIAYSTDTSYEDHLTFSSGDTILYDYAVRVNNKLGESGRYYGILSISAAPYQSPVDAGEDQTVDIGTEVKLRGAILKPKSPVVKVEWKIGGADWRKSDSGEATFTTSSTLSPDTTVCVFRIIDSLGNMFADTVLIKKEMQLIGYGQLPGAPSEGDNVLPYLTRFKDKYWYMAGTMPESYSVWSSTNLNDWRVENEAPGIANRGDIVAFNDNLYLFNMDMQTDGSGNQIKGKSYRSSNGGDWSEVAISLPPVAADSVIFKWDSSQRADTGMYRLYQIKGRIIAFRSCLYAVADIGENRGQSGQEAQCIVISKDGSAWNFAGPAPVNDYRFSYELIASNNRLYFLSHAGGLRATEVQHDKAYVSDNGGVSWTPIGLWDEDNSVNPDNITFVIGSDSLVFARYVENPGQADKETFLLNGKWNQIPSAMLGKQQIATQWLSPNSVWWARKLPVWLDGNRVYWIDPKYFVKSMKLF
jgi:hypothetical protein